MAKKRFSAEQIVALLRQIEVATAQGKSISLDDFGTGYSSLATLRAFPFDKIKLDKSFLKDLEKAPEARAMLRAVIAMGKSLGIPILAEGVETGAHLTFLKQHGCSEVQGYLLGRPSEHVATAAVQSATADAGAMLKTA